MCGCLIHMVLHPKKLNFKRKDKLITNLISQESKVNISQRNPYPDSVWSGTNRNRELLIRNAKWPRSLIISNNYEQPVCSLTDRCWKETHTWAFTQPTERVGGQHRDMREYNMKSNVKSLLALEELRPNLEMDCCYSCMHCTTI